MLRAHLSANYNSLLTNELDLRLNSPYNSSAYDLHELSSHDHP